MTQTTQLSRIKLQKGRYLVKRGEIWYLETCANGLQERRSLGTSELHEATKLAMKGDERTLTSKPGHRAGRSGVPPANAADISITDISGGDRQSESAQAPQLPLQPSAFLILLAIGRRQSHGYAIMQDIEQLSGNRLHIGPGTLYRTIQRMRVEGLLEEVEGGGSAGGDERRRVYRLTKMGLSAAREEGLRLDMLVKEVRARGLISQRSPRG
jgi:DNA-binding PadR family transcriptional regulator